MLQAAQALALNDFIIKQEPSLPSQGLNKVHPALLRIISDTYSVAHWFNQDDKGPTADPDALQEAIVSIGYRLVGFQPLSVPQLENQLDAAYHIGLIAFLTTLFLQIGRRPFLKYDLVARCLRNVIERKVNEDNNYIMMWLLIMGGISVLVEGDQPWLLQRISQMARSMDIKGWPQLHRLLIRFPWINSVHDGLGRALWDMSTTSTTEDHD